MIEINRKQVVRVLGIAILFLVMANGMSLLLKYRFGHDSVWGLMPLFDLDQEQNIPTLFQTILILFCSALLWLISVIRMRTHQTLLPWIMLAGIFFFLAIDEFASIHERLILPIRGLLHTSGAFFFAWIIPYGLTLSILAIVSVRFMREIPLKPRQLMIFSCLMYVMGAIGLEMIGGWYIEPHQGIRDLTYELLTTCEESLEMIGLMTFIYALMVYIENVQFGITIRIAGTSPHLDPSLDLDPAMGLPSETHIPLTFRQTGEAEQESHATQTGLRVRANS